MTCHTFFQRGRTAFVTAGVLLALVSGGAAVSAHAFGGGGGGGGMAGGCLGGMGQGPGMMMDGGRRLNQWLNEAQATPQQRSSIRQIMQTARADVQTMQRQWQGVHGTWGALFSAQTLDTAAIEKVRQERLTHHDAISQRMTQALIDAGNVLSPDQRSKVVALWQARRQSRMNPSTNQGRSTMPWAWDDAASQEAGQ